MRFVLELLASASPEYDWANTMLLFINVVNGALLLHSEDQTILYYCLVTLLIAVTKFNAIFKKDGYQMIIPTLVQVYSLHIKDKLITRAIKFVWTKFYQLNQNVFFLQVTAAASTLLSEEAALLSNSVGSKLPEESRRTAHMEAEEVKRLNAKAMFELNDTLRLEMRVEDELNILVSGYRIRTCLVPIYLVPVQLISVAFCVVCREIYALENMVLYIAFYGLYKP